MSGMADIALGSRSQGTTLLAGAGLSLLLTRKVGARPWRDLTPQCALIAAFTAELWWLII